jgi:WD40 repeat protein
VEWSSDARYLASSGEGGLILVWNSSDYSLCATLEGQRGMVTALAWTTDGTRLSSGSWGHGSDQLFIWDTQSWKLIRALEDPNELVFGVAWNADGERLVSAGSDGILRWWNPRSGECILSRQGHEGPVQSLRTSPDGRFLASCGDDGAIQIWEMDTGAHISTLRRDRPYERLNITGVKGLTDAQKLTLRMMGAVEEANNGE